MRESKNRKPKKDVVGCAQKTAIPSDFEEKENVLVQGVHSAPRLYHDHFHRHRSLDQLVPAAAPPCPTPQGVQPSI